MTKKLVLRFLAVLALTLLALPASAELGPEGNELRVNQRTDFKQRNPVVAFSPSGRSLAVWENDVRGLRGQFFAANGAPVGAELTLVANQGLGQLPVEGTVVSRRQPTLAFLTENEFALAWTEETAFVRSSTFIESRQIIDQDIFLQRFNGSGAPLGERVRVNTAATGLEAESRLTANGRSLLVVWEEDGGIFGRFLGLNPTDAFRLGYDEGIGSLPVAVKGRGNRYLAVWQEDGSERGISGRLFDSSGTGIGSAFRVNTDTTGRQRRHAVTTDVDGNFFVVWQHDVSKYESRLFAQTIGRGGNLIGGQVALAVDPDVENPIQMAPSVVLAGPDRFLVTWMTFRGQGSGVWIAGREIDGKGTPQGDMFLVTERRIERNFRRTALAADGTGRFLVSWETVLNGRLGIGARRLGE